MLWLYKINYITEIVLIKFHCSAPRLLKRTERRHAQNIFLIEISLKKPFFSLHQVRQISVRSRPTRGSLNVNFPVCPPSQIPVSPVPECTILRRSHTPLRRSPRACLWACPPPATTTPTCLRRTPDPPRTKAGPSRPAARRTSTTEPHPGRTSSQWCRAEIDPPPGCCRLALAHPPAAPSSTPTCPIRRTEAMRTAATAARQPFSTPAAGWTSPFGDHIETVWSNETSTQHC